MARLAGLLLALVLAASGPALAEPRLVTLGGSITEIVYALGAGDRIVAVDTTSVYPESVLSLPKIGYMRALSSETRQDMVRQTCMKAGVTDL